MANRFRDKKLTVKKNMTVKDAVFILNEASTLTAQSIMRNRQGLGTGMNPDPRRDIDKECGYIAEPSLQDFKDIYVRFGLAARIVNLLADECAKVRPFIYETEKKRDTPFEKKINALMDHPDLCLSYFVHKADALSGIGRHGGILIGIADGKAPDTPAAGYNDQGPVDNMRPTDMELMYLRSCDETLLRVSEIDNDRKSKRFGMPLMYEMLADTSQNPTPPTSTKPEWEHVHWTRVIHVAETYGVSSEIYADPRLRKVNEPLWDIRKILGGSAEMFWKGGFPGIAATVDPRFIEAGGINIDEESISEEMQRFMEGLQRYILGVGFQITSLSPQVADPTAHLMMQFTIIAICMQIPLRMFMGSEEAKLASGQDARAWKSKIVKRQVEYVTPKIYRPLVNRFIGMGVLPKTKQKDEFNYPKYNVSWPDVSLPDDTEKSAIADRRAASMMKYVTSAAYQLMQPSDFLRFVMGYDPLEVEQIMTNAKKPKELPFVSTQMQKVTKPGGKKPADSGSKGTSPSNSKVGAIKE